LFNKKNRPRLRSAINAGEQITTLYIAEIYGPGAIFLLLTVWVCLNSHIQPRKSHIDPRVVRYGRSKSSKLVSIESPYATSY